MEKILDRFLRYISVDTQSNEESTTQPSTAKQWDLLNMLADELRALGIPAETEEHGYVYAKIPGNNGKDTPTIGFMAHVDTAPDASGKIVVESKDSLRKAERLGRSPGLADSFCLTFATRLPVSRDNRAFLREAHRRHQAGMDAFWDA